MIDIKDEAIGVEISTSSVKVAEVQKKRKSIFLKYFSEEKIPVSALVAGVIRQPDNVKNALQICLEDLKKRKGEKKYVVCIIPDDKVYMQEETFPDLSIDKLRQAIQFKIQSFIPLPLTDVYWDFEVISKNKDGTLKVIVAAATKETVDSFYNVIKSVNLIPVCFESTSMSAMRVVKGEKDKNCILLDIGRTQTTISIAEGDAIKFSSTVHIGENQLIKVLEEFFKTDDDKSLQILKENGIDITNAELKAKIQEITSDLRQEVIKTMGYQNSSITDLYIYGEGSSIKGFKELILEGINCNILPVTSPVNLLNSNLSLEKIIPLLGASIRYLEQKNTAKRLNFLPSDASKEVINEAIKDKIFWALRIIAINLVAYTVIFFSFSLYLNNYQSYLNQKLNTLTSGFLVNNYNNSSNTIDSYNQSLERIKKAESAITDWNGVLTEIPQLVPSGVNLTSYNIDQNNSTWTITIAGKANNRNTLLSYLSLLENNSKYLTQVSLPISYIQSDQSITFTINANLLKV